MLQSVFGPQGDGSHGVDASWQGSWGGLPTYSGRQKQNAELAITLQPEFGPHLLFSHSSPCGTKKEIN